MPKKRKKLNKPRNRVAVAAKFKSHAGKHDKKHRKFKGRNLSKGDNDAMLEL